MATLTSFSKVLRDYARLEPGETDTWNPLHCDQQLAFRLGLYYALQRALKRADVDAQRIEVLDVGCGNGRSTRVYLDFGFSPAQLHGVDLRAGAIARARRDHPSIRYSTYDGRELPRADESVGWISLVTVLSSVAPHEARRSIVEQLHKKLAVGGYVFYFDLVRANDFAGGDLIEPSRCFERFERVWSLPIRFEDFGPYEAAERRELRATDLITWERGGQGSRFPSVPRPRALLSWARALLPPDVQRCLNRHAAPYEALLFRKVA